ncbi:hypothetical protein [Galactobacter valiniphilus]|uniref:hypothetical protein n=1 Tax=Galactobacter valiniphilus TaxID=2676122 RepID=UPI003735E9DF
MGNLYTYFAANDDQAAAAAIDGESFPDTSLVLDAGVDPIVELGTLESILSGRPYEEVEDDPRSGHLLADGGECWVVSLTDGAATALAAAQAPRCAEAAIAWSHTEELEGANPADLAEVIGGLSGLATHAAARGWKLYCWMSL